MLLTVSPSPLQALDAGLRLADHAPSRDARRITNAGFTRLQFKALLTAARESSCPCDCALVAMLGLLGLPIFESTGAGIAGLGEEHGYRAGYVSVDVGLTLDSGWIEGLRSHVHC